MPLAAWLASPSKVASYLVASLLLAFRALQTYLVAFPFHQTSQASFHPSFLQGLVEDQLAHPIQVGRIHVLVGLLLLVLVVVVALGATHLPLALAYLHPLLLLLMLLLAPVVHPLAFQRKRLQQVVVALPTLASVHGLFLL